MAKADDFRGLDDFLGLDTADASRKKMADEAVDFAKLYVSAFVDNAAGAQLLKHWTNVIAKRRTPVNAPITEYAANEAVRLFIEDIHGQLALARSGGLRVS